ncbi:MAG: class IV adenylate cyclase [Calditrichaeota bacterium]|nr:MAG: class IV adenylate cyclase [Calditrichota bacterium]MBL1205659.1 class IV adenylate cyclase [Calditrichota bacterium]NOG45487.1 class IV adenylate cyclase [Calditrichota bacterium]
MGLNIEIKARCKNHKTIEEVMQKMNFPFEGSEVQTDTFFNVPHGRLKVREYNNKTAVLIPYIRPDVKTPRASDYVLLDIKEPNQTIDILESMFGIRLVVEKNRKIYHYDNIRVHLDSIEELGTFIELEGVVTKSDQREETLQKVELLMELFEIKDNDIVLNAYVDLIEKMKLDK